MTLYAFNSLDRNAKAEATWNGNQIAERQDDKYRYLLYSLSDFFVEVSYNSRENAIREFKAFKTETMLLPYLNFIRIDTF